MASKRKGAKRGGQEEEPAAASASAMADSSAEPAKQQKSGGGGLLAWINGTTIGTLLAVFYVYTTVNSMSFLMDPFKGVEISPGADRIKPLWAEGSPVRIVTYLSTSPKRSLKAINGTDKNAPLIWWGSEP